MTRSLAAHHPRPLREGPAKPTSPHLAQEVKSQTLVTLSIVHCPPVTTAIIRRPHVREQLGFCVEDGIVSSQPRSRGRRWGGPNPSPLSSMALPLPPDLQPSSGWHR